MKKVIQSFIVKDFFSGKVIVQAKPAGIIKIYNQI
jgi:hypothetical protein